MEVNDVRMVRRLGRTTGLLYLVLVVFGMFSPIVLETLVVPGDAGATAGNVLDSLWLFRFSLVSWVLIVVTDVVLSVVLYLLLEPVSRLLSLISAAFRGVYSAVLAAYLLSLFKGFMLLTGHGGATALEGTAVEARALADFETFSVGFILALVFFGIHLIFFGILLERSKYVPTVLTTLLVVAGGGYILNSAGAFFLPFHSDLASTLLLMPALLGEIGLTGWLLVKGVSVGTEPEAEPSSARDHG